jgi:hypothetical protein
MTNRRTMACRGPVCSSIAGSQKYIGMVAVAALAARTELPPPCRKKSPSPCGQPDRLPAPAISLVGSPQTDGHVASFDLAALAQAMADGLRETRPIVPPQAHRDRHHFSARCAHLAGAAGLRLSPINSCASPLTEILCNCRHACQMERPRPPDDDAPSWRDGPDCFGRGHPLLN